MAEITIEHWYDDAPEALKPILWTWVLRHREEQVERDRQRAREAMWKNMQRMG